MALAAAPSTVLRLFQFKRMIETRPRARSSCASFGTSWSSSYSPCSLWRTILSHAHDASRIDVDRAGTRGRAGCGLGARTRLAVRRNRVNQGWDQRWESRPSVRTDRPSPARASYEKDTREHYQDQNVARAYHEQFAAGFSLRRLSHVLVARAEQRAVRRLLASVRSELVTVADVPCGTGKLLPVFRDLGVSVVG